MIDVKLPNLKKIAEDHRAEAIMNVLREMEKQINIEIERIERRYKDGVERG